MTTFRLINIETDAADMARLYSFTLAEPINVETAREWWTLREGEIRTTMLALSENGEVLGYWDLDRETWMKPGYFFIKVIVDPQVRNQGLGTKLYADALQSACDRGAIQLGTRIQEADEASLRFAQKRGFEIERHFFESTLDLNEFNEHHFDEVISQVRTQGFEFISLAEAGNTEANQHKLYEVNRSASLDDPGSDGTFPDFYAFSKNVFEASWFRADTQILAAHGEEWVGLSAVAIYKDGHAYNAFTGVRRDYRGRRLAQALKLHTVMLARKEGMRYIRTHNDSFNAPMLAINRKLGYKAEPGIYKLVYTLEQN